MREKFVQGVASARKEFGKISFACASHVTFEMREREKRQKTDILRAKIEKTRKDSAMLSPPLSPIAKVASRNSRIWVGLELCT